MQEIVTSYNCVLAQNGGGFGNPVFLIGIVLALFAFMFIAGRGQRKEKQAREQMLEALERNDRVVTRGGLIGVVTEVKDDEIVVKVDEGTNTKIRMKKWAVAGLLNKDKDKEAGSPQ